MKYKTLFRLILKALGVWIVLMGVSQLAGNVLWMLIDQQARFSSYGWRNLIAFLPQILQVAFGCYLFFDGKWVVDKAIPSNRPYCHECGYDLTGAVGDVCNECGTPFRGPTSSTSSL